MEYEKEKCLKNSENANAEGFKFAAADENAFERNKFTEGIECRKVLDILVFLI
jgi:hypothetical protein